MIKVLAVVGTIALLLVSGGIFDHNIEYVHHFLPSVPAMAKEFGLGLAVGLAAVGIVALVKVIFKKKA